MKYVADLRDVKFVLSKNKVLDLQKSCYIGVPYKRVVNKEGDLPICVLPERVKGFNGVYFAEFKYDVLSKTYSACSTFCTKVTKIDNNGKETVLAEYTKDIFKEEKEYIKKYKQKEKDFKHTFLATKEIVKQELKKIYGDDYTKHHKADKFNNGLHTMENRYPVLIDLGDGKTFVKYIHIIGDFSELENKVYCTYNDVEYTDYNKLFDDVKKEVNKQDDIQ